MRADIPRSPEAIRSSTVARKASAVIGPTPGTLISRRQISSSRAMSRTRFVRRANCSSIVARIASSGATSGITSGSPPASSRTRAAKAARRRAELEAGLPQHRAHHVLDRPHFVQHRAARDEERSPEAALPVLDVNLPEPPRAHDLRQGAGVVAIGLVGHRLHRGVGLPRLDADGGEALSAQAVVQPGRQRTSLEPDPIQRQIDCARLPTAPADRSRREPPSRSARSRRPCRSRSLPKTRPFRQNTSRLLLPDVCGDPASTTFPHPDRSSRLRLARAKTPITPSDSKLYET